SGCGVSTDGGGSEVAPPAGPQPPTVRTEIAGGDSSGRAATPVQGSAKPAADAPTEVVTLVAVDAAGQPTNGFTVPDPDPVGALHCDDGTPSRSAATPGIYHCGASADNADICWAV